MLRPWYRFELVELSIHWGHVAEAIDLRIEGAGAGVWLEVTVWYFSDYWDVDHVPRRAAFRLRAAEVPGGLAIAAPAPVATMTFDPDRPKVELLAPEGRAPAMPDFWAPLTGWASAVWRGLPDPARICLIPARLVVIDGDAQPPRVEARFTDAHGAEVRIADKEPIFRAGDEPEGTGEVAGIVEAATLVDRRWIYRVAIERPWGLAALDGRTALEVEEAAVRWRG